MKQILTPVIIILFILNGLAARACPSVNLNACYFNFNGQTYIQAQVDGSFYSCLTSFAGHSYIAHVNVYSGTTLVATNNFPLVNPFPAISVGSIAPPFNVCLAIDDYFAGSYTTLNFGCTTANTQCPPPVQPNWQNATGCFYRVGTKTIVKVNVDPSVTLFITANGLTPALSWYNHVTHLPLSPYHWAYGSVVNVNEIDFDLSGFPGMNTDSCYDIYIQLQNSNGSHNSNNDGLLYQVCACPNPPCTADFSITMNPATSTTSNLTFLTLYSGPIVSEHYSITDNSLVTWYSGSGGVSLIVPDGSYLICHSIITGSIDAGYDTCSECKQVCYSASDNSDLNQGADNCPAGFGMFMNSDDATHAILNVSPNYSTPIISETWTVTGTGISYSSPGPMSWILPYGSYTVCHTVVYGNNQTCTICQSICWYGGDGGVGSNDNGNSHYHGRVYHASNELVTVTDIHPNPASSQTTLSFILSKPSQVEMVIINNLGQTVYKYDLQQIANGKHDIIIPVSALPSGLYTIKLYTDGQLCTQKMSVMH